ncbi:MAG TPA: hypothetical protein VMT89_09800 [Candidatus Acidoferrales bacterium]|nr:hypothetical protein [Candidatus Acidoferrales bacterium]
MTFERKKGRKTGTIGWIAAAALAVGVLCGSASPARAHSSFYFSLGIPAPAVVYGPPAAYPPPPPPYGYGYAQPYYYGPPPVAFGAYIGGPAYYGHWGYHGGWGHGLGHWGHRGWH